MKDLVDVLSGLNSGQQAAVLSDSKKLLCLAGAGTGKTHTMMARISKLIAVDQVDPASILALTFTNAAAFEMKERFMKNHPGVRSPEFRTFHSFCYSLLAMDLRVRAALQYTSVPEIIEASDMKQITTTVKEQLGIKLSDSILWGTGNTISEKKTIDLYQKAVANALRRQNVITFDLLSQKVCDLFVTNSDLVKKYKDRYQYIFVDEFQDTDRTQYDFVMSFEDSYKFVVGDALQALYGFRGADSSLIKQISRDPEWEKVRLSQNYRSTVQICEYANNMSHYAEDEYRVALEASREGLPVITDSSYCDRWDIVDVEALSEVLQDLRTRSGSSAVLCRSNAETAETVEYLTAHGISCRTSKKNVDALHILKGCMDGEYLLSWLATFLNANKYAEYIRLEFLRSQGAAPVSTPAERVSDFLKTYASNENVSTRGNTVMQVREVLKSSDLSEEKCEKILKLLDMPQVKKYTSDPSPKKIVEFLIEAVQDTEESGEVYVGTIHSSKGLEYDNVFLLGVGGKRFRIDRDDEENLNVLYVGITRARNYLRIFME